MMKSLIVRDETFLGDVLHHLELAFTTTEITISDLISERVRQEVKRQNEQLENRFYLIQPSEKEALLNKKKLDTKSKYPTIDAEKQIYVALDAFQKNHFLVLIDKRQAEQLDEKIIINDFTQVSFVKMTPLVGG